MKNLIRVSAVSAACALSLALATPAIANSDYNADPFWTGQKPTYTEQTLAMGPDGVFPNYRIPALTVTNTGTVLASYDGRPSGADSPGPNSILQRRSNDNGNTFEPQTVIHGGKTTKPIEGFSDPSYIVDRETGSIFNFHVKSFDRGFGNSLPGVDPTDRNVIHAEVSVSNDDGVTWEHRVITADITPDLTVRSRFAASGQGIQLKYGPHAGRLLQQFTIINGQGVFQAVSIYSDDHGATWHSGNPVGTGMDENKTVELSDGRIMLNSRDSARSGFRKVAYSSDGGITYGDVTIDRELPDPTNNASIVRAFPEAPFGSDRAKVLMFSNANSSRDRVNGTVRVSCDDGETWPIAKTYAPGAHAYSTLATPPDGQVGLLYEPGHNGLVFAKFNMSWLQGLCAPVTPASDLTIIRGESGTTEVSITNQLGPAIQATSFAAEAPAGWQVSMPATPKVLPPNKTWTASVSVQVPASATGGTYTIPLRLTDKSGRASAGSLTVVVPKIESEIQGRISVTSKHSNPKTTPYVVGDRLSFEYRVTNLTSAVTTVVPTGNLLGLDPAAGAPNCRWRNLAANGAYTCSSAYHLVTAADLEAGSFTPRTTWVSTSGTDVTTVQVDGPTVTLSN